MWICHPTLEVGHMAFPDEVARNPGSALTDPLQELVAIGPYEQLPATCNDHDPRSFEVAKRVADLIESHLPDVRVEHVGSTAVPGCAGKGVVDLMILYPPGQLPEVREGLDALGFQRQTGDLPGISANAGENGPRPVRRPTNPGMLAPKNGRAVTNGLLQNWLNLRKILG